LWRIFWLELQALPRTGYAPGWHENVAIAAIAVLQVKFVRIDVRGEWLCLTSVKQAENLWVNQLLHSKDVVAQAEAVTGVCVCECFVCVYTYVLIKQRLSQVCVFVCLFVCVCQYFSPQGWKAASQIYMYQWVVSSSYNISLPLTTPYPRSSKQRPCLLSLLKSLHVWPSFFAWV